MEEYLKDIPSRIREPPSEKTSAASEAPLDFVLLEDRRSDEAVPLFLKKHTAVKSTYTEEISWGV
jgi:hypothetical protein